jgi:peptidoglycan/LPS O-acetylase OafA/YrhL
MFTLKNLAFAILALVLGIIGLSMVFSNLGPSESETGRVITAAIFFFLCGLGIGYFNPRAWIISGLSAWGSISFGLLMVLSAIGKYGNNAFAAQKPPYISVGLVILLLPVSLSLLGGYIGQRLKNNQAIR